MYFLRLSMRNPALKCRAGGKWSCRLLALACLFQITARADQIIYDDALQTGWQNWGWATLNYNNTSPVHSGSASVSVTIATGTQAIYIAHTAFDSSPYTNLVFWINGGPTGGQQLKVQGHANGLAQASTNLPPLMTNTWQQFTIPLTILGVTNSPNMDGFWIQDRIGAVQPVFYVDDISLQAGAPILPGTNANVTIQIDAQANRHAISPLIYGVGRAHV